MSLIANWDGGMGVSAGECAPDCQAVASADDASILQLRFPQGMNLTRFSLTLEWSASTEGTSVLAVGIQLIPCDGCDPIPLGDVSGTSPLSFGQDPPHVANRTGVGLRVVVWEPLATQVTPAGIVFATVPQDFHGTLLYSVRSPA